MGDVPFNTNDETENGELSNTEEPMEIPNDIPEKMPEMSPAAEKTMDIINQLSDKDKKTVEAYAESLLSSKEEDNTENVTNEPTPDGLNMEQQPMNETFIFTKKQLNKLMENNNAVNIVARAKNNSLADFTNAATNSNTLSDINKASKFGDVNLTISGPESKDSQPTQVIKADGNNSVQNAITTQGNDDLIRAGGSIEISGDNINEEYKTYTKKEIENKRKNRKK